MASDASVYPGGNGVCVTGLIGCCPPYTLLGIDTTRESRHTPA